MKKSIFFLAFLFSSASLRLHAQSIQNTSWKTFFADPISDSITIHFGADASFITGSKGDTLVRSDTRISGDTLTFNDYGGIYGCLGLTGKYKIHMTQATLNLELIYDPCEGRSQSSAVTTWRKISR